ncbi:DMT family transporter [Micromonospora sp. BRA006-A]|uniref:DMT family transporter n=1 Tax=Micromonospora sp. BRA006-A TaxID=2962860 RepID=UPI00296EC4AB|nr:DMT family transporter [Micromonospora sp. BRA006-A]MDW3844993.1 DMT family transporter [Micromonospora sp. BRA006-A]
MHTDLPPTVGRGTLYILLAAIAWGTGGAAAAVLYDTSGLGPVAVSFWRFAGGVLLLAAGHLTRRRPSAHPRVASTRPRHQWRQVVTTGVGLAVYQTAYFAAVGYAGLAVATMVTLGAGPVLIALGSRLTLGERLGRTGGITVVTALAGLVLLLGGGSAGSAPAPALGLACALLSAGGYAAVTLLNRKLGRDGSGQTSLLGGFAVGMICLTPLALLDGILPTAGDIRWTVGLLAFLAVAPTAVAYTLFFAGLAAVRATTASIIALVEPVTAALIAVLVLDERLTVTAVLGSVVLLAAVVTLVLGEPGPAPSSAAAAAAAAVLRDRDADMRNRRRPRRARVGGGVATRRPG